MYCSVALATPEDEADARNGSRENTCGHVHVPTCACSHIHTVIHTQEVSSNNAGQAWEMQSSKGNAKSTAVLRQRTSTDISKTDTQTPALGETELPRYRFFPGRTVPNGSSRTIPNFMNKSNRAVPKCSAGVEPRYGSSRAPDRIREQAVIILSLPNLLCASISFLELFSWLLLLVLWLDCLMDPFFITESSGGPSSNLIL